MSVSFIKTSIKGHLSARIPPVAHPRISPTTKILAEMFRKVTKYLTHSLSDFLASMSRNFLLSHVTCLMLP